jgi:hypothetical protein
LRNRIRIISLVCFFIGRQDPRIGYFRQTMGDKEVKQWLKDARDLIKAKEYKNALKEVKKVLNRDKGNYMGLVFCGLCLSELEEPVQAQQVGRQYFAVVGSVLTRRRFDANPDPTFHFDATSVGDPDRMFLGLPDTDPLVRGADPAPDPSLFS